MIVYELQDDVVSDWALYEMLTGQNILSHEWHERLTPGTGHPINIEATQERLDPVYVDTEKMRRWAHQKGLRDFYVVNLDLVRWAYTEGTTPQFLKALQWLTDGIYHRRQLEVDQIPAPNPSS